MGTDGVRLRGESYWLFRLPPGSDAIIFIPMSLATVGHMTMQSFKGMEDTVLPCTLMVRQDSAGAQPTDSHRDTVCTLTTSTERSWTDSALRPQNLIHWPYLVSCWNHSLFPSLHLPPTAHFGVSSLTSHQSHFRVDPSASCLSCPGRTSQLSISQSK